MEDAVFSRFHDRSLSHVFLSELFSIVSVLLCFLHIAVVSSTSHLLQPDHFNTNEVVPLFRSCASAVFAGSRPYDTIVTFSVSGRCNGL